MMHHPIPQAKHTLSDDIDTCSSHWLLILLHHGLYCVCYSVVFGDHIFSSTLINVILSWHITADGIYALKKVLIRSEQHLELVRQEIRVSSQFSHPNLLPLLEHAIIAVKVGFISQYESCNFFFMLPVFNEMALYNTRPLCLL